MERNLNYKGYECSIQKSQYHSGNVCLELWSPEEGPVARCTTNVRGAELRPGEVIVKDYSENEGMLQFLLDNGIVFRTGETISFGYLRDVPICKVLI